MINLLPHEDKIFIKREYLSRLFVVIGVTLAGAVFISIIFLAPTLFLLDNYKSDLSRQIVFSSGQAEVIDTQNIISEIKKLNSRISVLKSSQEKLYLSFIIEKVIEMKTKGVKITDLNYEGAKGEEKGKISISGIAEERQALLDFINLLKEEFDEGNVLSPVSNLLNEKNASFSLTILNIK